MGEMMDWTKYAPYFTEDEFRCHYTGKCDMKPEFMDKLLAIRIEYNKPMKITSGYRDRTNPIEVNKHTTGEHTMGVCCDVGVSGEDAVRLLEIALRHGITRVGVQQKGEGRFLHIGIGGGDLPNPAIWSY
jgi:uncharacterized protein YcbK (DUF882 family)